MKSFRIAVMLNGAEGIDYFEKLSNLKQIASGLESNETQSVLYYNLETVNSARNSLLRLIMHFTGNGYAYLLDSILTDVVNAIIKGINKNHIKEGMTIKLSLFGFSDGATLARHFGMEYITNRLYQALPNDIKRRNLVELEAEYLFDSLCLETPVTVSVLSQFAIFNFQRSSYYQTKIPKGTKAYHAVSLDDCLVMNPPALIDKVNEQTEEVWFASDHLGVGGGHMLPYTNVPLAATDALQYIVMRAKQNGLQFRSDFLKKMKKHENSSALRVIHNQSRYDVAPHFRRAREVVVKKDGRTTEELPLIHESVVRRMEADLKYRPLGLLPYSSIRMLRKNGTTAIIQFVEPPVPFPIVPYYHKSKVAAKDNHSTNRLSKPLPAVNKSPSKRISPR